VPRSRKRAAIPPLPQYVFMVWYLVEHRGNFTFTFQQYAEVGPPVALLLDLRARLDTILIHDPLTGTEKLTVAQLLKEFSAFLRNTEVNYRVYEMLELRSTRR